uniref:Uncharacterized protein n=1 Tax=Heterosigma akashiwo TaxID=2829 RepID=A0A7S3XN14_HETAK
MEFTPDHPNKFDTLDPERPDVLHSSPELFVSPPKSPDKLPGKLQNTNYSMELSPPAVPIDLDEFGPPPEEISLVPSDGPFSPLSEKDPPRERGDSHVSAADSVSVADSFALAQRMMEEEEEEGR